MGKSAIANYFTLQMATSHQLPAVYFSLEMTKKQLQYRLWSLISEFHCYSHYNLTKIRGDRLRKQRAGRISLNQQEMDSIAKVHGVSRTSVHGLLKSHGYELRKQKRLPFVVFNQ